jgi:hypothetical protein
VTFIAKPKAPSARAGSQPRMSSLVASSKSVSQTAAETKQVAGSSPLSGEATQKRAVTGLASLAAAYSDSDEE